VLDEFAIAFFVSSAHIKFLCTRQVSLAVFWLDVSTATIVPLKFTLCKSLPVIPHIGVPSKLDVSLNYGHT
jgi:hypothetical protein